LYTASLKCAAAEIVAQDVFPGMPQMHANASSLDCQLLVAIEMTDHYVCDRVKSANLRIWNRMQEKNETIKQTKK
jgi:hypothetical protein